MSIYQFLIAVRQKDGELLTNDAGETTRYVINLCTNDSKMFTPFISHLMGFFYRTIRMVENGIKPAYVFDGKPPELKAGVVRVYSIPHENILVQFSCSFQNVWRGERKLRRREKRLRRPVSLPLPYHVHTDQTTTLVRRYHRRYGPLLPPHSQSNARA